MKLHLLFLIEKLPYSHSLEIRMLDEEDIAVFEKAAELGVRRTVHAGEAGPAQMVWKVMCLLFPSRGHLYLFAYLGPYYHES